MFETLGLAFSLMWAFVKYFFVLWIAILIPLIGFLALTRFVLAVSEFGFKNAFRYTRDALMNAIGRKR